MKLLGFLRRTHGKDEKPADEAGPSRITLNRRKVEELTVGGGKTKATVAVEVRQKRTYVKRTDVGVEVDAEQREVGPVVPADQLGVDALQAGEGDGNLDGLRAHDVGVGQHQPVIGNDDPGADAAGDALGAVVELDLADIDADDGVQQAVEAPAHGRLGGSGQTQQNEGDGGQTGGD